MWCFCFASKANLEMNRAGLAADLVCMFEGRLSATKKAKIQEQIKRFFIAGAERINLIARVMDLDVDIAGYDYDISNLQQTSNELESLSNIGGKNLQNHDIKLYEFRL